MSTLLTIPDREIDIASRWTEIHVKKLIRFMDITDKYHKCFMKEFVYENSYFTVLIQIVPRCIRNEEWIPCINEDCESTTWMPRVLMYLDPYMEDVFFTLDIPNELSIPLIYEKFEEHRGEKQMCICGRIGRTDYFHDEDNGKCNNCYIYGMKRGVDCSICLADDGKPWIKTSCDHYFHDMCWKRIEDSNGVKKCPLCRSNQNRGTIIKI
jgi:hypothetical protein